MGTGTVVLLVILAIIVFGIFFIVSIYNKLIQLRNRFKNAFAQIDVQLKRRYDLIPNLVETAKGYMKHEREALEAVIKARNQPAAFLFCFGSFFYHCRYLSGGCIFFRLSGKQDRPVFSNPSLGL